MLPPILPPMLFHPSPATAGRSESAYATAPRSKLTPAGSWWSALRIEGNAFFGSARRGPLHVSLKPYGRPAELERDHHQTAAEEKLTKRSNKRCSTRKETARPAL